MKPTKLPYAIIFITLIFILQSCETQRFRSNYRSVNWLLHDTKNVDTKPFLKAHLKNGDICILQSSWNIDTEKNIVYGNGSRYDFNRKNIQTGILIIAIDSVAIFETNKKIVEPESNRVAGLTILASLDAILGVLCITHPKSCFGSCPTFYLNEKDNFHYADAEGFSSAISPSMEYVDIDALNYDNKRIDSFSITMKNEALETHCVNDVKLLAYPIKKGEHIYHATNDKFYLCENMYSLANAKATEGEVTSLLKDNDRVERFSTSDKNNLCHKEEIYLNFNDIKSNEELGFIINYRQTLMTTYFIYSAMGYMGNEVGDIFAKVETQNDTKEKLDNGIRKELGNIDVYVWNEKFNTWEYQDGFYETGPIAFNKQFVPIKNTSFNKNIKIKLVMNEGLWRIDYVGLTNIKEEVKPLEISPISIYNKGKIDNTALSLINDTNKYLISMPGSEYKFNFALPNQNENVELFLYSKGYYLEWMRKHWIKDKNLLKLKQMVDNPKKYLKKEANNYKKYELQIEREFWDSKIDTKTFSYDEN